MKKIYRSNLEIVYDLVKAARGSKRKTHLMYDSALSFVQLHKYLNILIEQGLINERFEKFENSQVYCVTPKGLEYLDLVDRLLSLIDLKSIHEGPAIVSATPLIESARPITQ